MRRHHHHPLHTPQATHAVKHKEVLSDIVAEFKEGLMQRARRARHIAHGRCGR